MSAVRAAVKASLPQQLKVILVTAGGSFAARSGDVGPSPFGYCSVSTLRTPSSVAASASRPAMETTCGPVGIADSRRSWMSTTQSREVGVWSRIGILFRVIGVTS